MQILVATHMEIVVFDHVQFIWLVRSGSVCQKFIHPEPQTTNNINWMVVAAGGFIHSFIEKPGVYSYVTR